MKATVASDKPVFCSDFVKFRKGSGVQFLSDPCGGTGGRRMPTQARFLTQVPAAQCSWASPRASLGGLGFSQWWFLGKQGCFSRGVWLPRSRKLKPPGETWLFLETAPHHWGHILLLREGTAQTQVWRHGLPLLRESGHLWDIQSDKCHSRTSVIQQKGL